MLEFLIRITEPHQSVSKPETIRVLRLIAGLHLLSIPMIWIVYLVHFVFPAASPISFPFALSIMMLSIFDYLLTRSKFVRIAIYTPPIIVMCIALFLHHVYPQKIVSVFVPLIAALIAAVFFSLRELRFFILCSWVLLVYMVLQSDVAYQGETAGASILYVLITIMIYGIRWHQSWLRQLFLQKIQESYDQQLLLLHEAFDGVVHVQNQNIQKISDGFVELLQLKRTEIIDQPLHKFFPQGLSNDRNNPVQMYNAEGTICYVEVVQREGFDPTEMIYAFRDVTKLHLERIDLQITDRYSSIGTIAAGVIHELNTPLMIAQGNVELEQRNNGSDFLETARIALHQMNSIINDLRIFSHVEKEERTSDMMQVVEGVIRLVRHQFGHQCVFSVQSQRNFSIAISESKFAQILLNLLSNAAHSKSRNQNLVHVDIHVLQQDSFVVIHITDDGCGVSPEIEHRIFDPFFTNRKNGTGLGLSIVQGILSNIGGKIEFSSRHIGSQFTVFLPIDTSIPTTNKNRVNDSNHVRTILIVDNEPNLIEIVKNMLQEQVCHSATNIDHAIEMIEEYEYDCILCDIIMPEKGGEYFLEYCKKQKPEILERIIFMTGGVVSFDQKEYFQNYRRIQKPFRMKELFDCIQELSTRSST